MYHTKLFEPCKYSRVEVQFIGDGSSLTRISTRRLTVTDSKTRVQVLRQNTRVIK